MRRGSEVYELSVFNCEMWRKEPFPVSFSMSLHIVGIDTGWFKFAINELQDRFLAERTRTRALARASL